MRVQPAGAPSPIFPNAASISLSTGAPLLPAGYHGISPVEIYKPLCGAIEVAPQSGFIVRRGNGGAAPRHTAFPSRERQRGGGFAASKESQPRLAALGSPFQGKGLAWTLPPSSGRRCPEGAEVGWGKRYPRNKAFPSRGRCPEGADRAGAV